MTGKQSAGTHPAIVATVAVPLYNHAEFIEERLESLFAQWLPGLELLLVDDASCDDGFAIAERVLARHGHIQTTTIRNETTAGVGVLATVLQLAQGDVIVQADSDDVALPGRLEATLACFRGDPACRLVTSNAVLLSPDGFAAGLLDTDQPDEVFTDPRPAATTGGGNRWLGATMAFHRALFRDLPMVTRDECSYGLDLLMPFRALLLGSHHYLATPLVGWRQHGRNTNRLAGHTGTSSAEMERYGALELMILRQKLRDAEYIAAHPTAKAVPDDLVRLCSERFFASYDRWVRVRNPVAAGQAEAAARDRPMHFPSTPAITSLRVGQRIGFDTAFGAAIVAGWRGFNDVEDWGVWTRRIALVCFRIVDPEVTALRLLVRGLHYVDCQRVSFSIGFAEAQHVTLRGPERRFVDVPVVQPGIAWLAIHAYDAAPPPTTDTRLLGVGLCSVEAVGALSPAAVSDAAGRECEVVAP